jgi:hypothetical protein
VFGTMGLVGTSKSYVDSEIATKSPRYERRGRILLKSLEYQQNCEIVTKS